MNKNKQNWIKTKKQQRRHRQNERVSNDSQEQGDLDAVSSAEE